MSNITQLGRQILDIAEENDITISEMAKQIRKSPGHLYNIIHGNRFPSEELLKTLETKYNRQLIMLLVKK